MDLGGFTKEAFDQRTSLIGILLKKVAFPNLFIFENLKRLENSKASTA